MFWWDEDAARWESEVQEMTSWFPVSQWSESTSDGAESRKWDVIVEPIPPKRETALVYSDLHRGGPVDIEPGGRLRHNTRCHAQHQLHTQLHGVVVPDEAFLVELKYRMPPAHPAARCIDPPMSKDILPDHSHFYEPDLICPLFPPDGTWDWRKNTAADYLMHTAIWLVKTAVWKATRDARGEGIWLGSDVDHTLERVLSVPGSVQCPCGSGRRYRTCHRRKHWAPAHQRGNS